MFREPEIKGFKVVKPAEEVLKIAPWLWAFGRIWAKGFCCETGSVHLVNPVTFSQKIDNGDDGISDIFFLSVSDGIFQAREVPKLMRQVESPDGFGSYERNPRSHDGSIAKRIIMAIDHERDWVAQKSKSRALTIPQVVIRRPGEVDRTSHYFIYQETSSHDWDTVAKTDVLKIILDSDPSQTPA